MAQIIFMTGASGSGKSTLLKALSSHLPHVICLHFDSIGVPPTEQMIKEFGSPSAWQKAMTQAWLEKIFREYQGTELVLLEGQINLEFIIAACKKFNISNYQIILIHCADAIRHQRLSHQRQQPELINSEMDNWAAFLKRQALDLNVKIIDTSKLSIAHALKNLIDTGIIA